MDVHRRVPGSGLASLLALLVCTAATVAGAEPVPHRTGLEIAAAGPLHVGERRSLTVRVRLPPSAARPLLLTGVAEGPAVEVVRGRLLRSDARDPEATPLVLSVPLVARQPGQAIVRVRLDGYVCAPRCVPWRRSARAVVEVRGDNP